MVINQQILINQFSCEWRGNYALEIGDKISLVTRDNDTVSSYVLNDTVNYNGILSQKTEWEYNSNDTETESNPTSLGDTLKQTYARVDKINKQIDLIASDNEANSNKIAKLQLDTDSISASVNSIQTNTTNAIDGINSDIQKLTNKVNATMTSEEVKLEIQSELSNGVNKITTNTGYTFDDNGMTVEKSGSEMKTQITEDGMTVYRGDTEVLTANNTGVDAINLHATTYLIVGKNSRFEDYGENRTGCFWIGG